MRIELEDIQPTIWRSVIVPKAATLGWVHAVIQVAMGWTNSHLHQFSLGDVIISDPSFNLNEFEGDPPVTDEKKVTGGQVAKARTRFSSASTTSATPGTTSGPSSRYPRGNILPNALPSASEEAVLARRRTAAAFPATRICSQPSGTKSTRNTGR